MHWPQGPTLKLCKLSTPSHLPGWQVRNSVRLGQAEPPKSGGARTERKRFCSPIPQLLEQDVHGENSDTTQSRGHGIRQACSKRGLGSKYSQMASSAGTPSDLCTQPTSLVWMPSSPRVHTAGLGTPALRIDTGTHWFQAPSCQSYSSLCQSHTRKQLCWLLGRSDCWQLVCNVVQPSEWAHHTARLWLPPGPHSLPMHLPHGPKWQTKTKQKHNYNEVNRATESAALVCTHVQYPDCILFHFLRRS